MSLSFLPLPCVEERRKCPSSRLCSRLLVSVLSLPRPPRTIAAAETPLLLASHHQLEGARRPELTPVEDSYRWKSLYWGWTRGSGRPGANYQGGWCTSRDQEYAKIIILTAVCFYVSQKYIVEILLKHTLRLVSQPSIHLPHSVKPSFQTGSSDLSRFSAAEMINWVGFALCSI